jgi:hypothetical protein
MSLELTYWSLVAVELVVLAPVVAVELVVICILQTKALLPEQFN